MLPLLIAAAIVALAGIAGYVNLGTEEGSNIAHADSRKIFETVQTDWNWKIVYDRGTGVMYAVSTGNKNNGTFTLMVDADGMPRIWEGWEE